MSSKEGKKNKKKKSIEEEDFLPPVKINNNVKSTTNILGNNSKRKDRNNTAVAKGQINLIIQMLESSDGDGLDEKTMRYNVNIAVRNLKEVINLL